MLEIRHHKEMIKLRNHIIACMEVKASRERRALTVHEKAEIEWYRAEIARRDRRIEVLDFNPRLCLY